MRIPLPAIAVERRATKRKNATAETSNVQYVKRQGILRQCARLKAEVLTDPGHNQLMEEKARAKEREREKDP